MTRLANFSGQEVIGILQKNFGFFFVSQKGSHCKLRCRGVDSAVTVVVPLHSELAVGTRRNLLHQAQVNPVDFLIAAGK